MERKKSYGQTKLSDVLDVKVIGYVVNYWHSTLPVLKTQRFHTRKALMRWIEQNKTNLYFAGKPVFTIESVMQVVAD